jgi:tetratricopeptide (TPR) repeat protein
VTHRSHEVLKACKAALELAPQIELAHQLRIHELLDLKRYGELLHACDLALHTIKPSAELYLLRGMAKDGLADYSGATDDYTMALSLQPDSPRVLCRRGWSYLADDSDRHALRDFEDAVRLDRNDADAYSGRGLARARLGLYLDAVTDADKSLQLRQKDWRMHYNAACTYFESALAVDSQSRKTGPPAIRAEKPYIDRAVKLVSLAVELAPVEQRTVLLQKTIPNDRAIKPFRQHLKKLLEGLKFEQQPRPRLAAAPG